MGSAGIEGRGEEGRRGREGEEMGMGRGCRRLARGRERGVATSSNSVTTPSTPRKPWMNACSGRGDSELGQGADRTASCTFR